MQHQHEVAGRDQDQLGKRPPHLGKDPFERADAVTDPLHRDAGVDQLSRSAKRHEIFERVAVVPTLRPSRRGDEVRLRPVLKLAARDAQDPDHLTGTKQTHRAGAGSRGERR